MGYDAVYDCRLVSRSSQRDGSGEAVLSRVVGKHCESGDIVVLDEYLPADVRPGDLVIHAHAFLARESCDVIGGDVTVHAIEQQAADRDPLGSRAQAGRLETVHDMHCMLEWF